MPMLQLKITPPQDAQRRALLAQRLTTLTHEILGKRRRVTALVIEDLPKDRWFLGAEAPQEAAAWLEISVTQGTNTSDEKQAFVEQAYRELEQQLGSLADASYVIVREVPATDWGFGGQTQEARQKSRTPAP
jgi:4-oxalocrotonate tautomerase